MKELKPRIHENGIDYILVGDYYVPDWKLPEEHRPIGRWGNLHRAYLRQFCPALYSTLVTEIFQWKTLRRYIPRPKRSQHQICVFSGS